MATTWHRKLSPLLRKKPIIRKRDLARLGLPRTALGTSLADGSLSRLSRGVYAVTGHAVSEYHSLAQAAVRVPNGVVSGVETGASHERSRIRIQDETDSREKVPASGGPDRILHAPGHAKIADSLPTRHWAVHCALKMVLLWSILRRILFIEDEAFHRRRMELIEESELFALMDWLDGNPESGKVIPRSGGLRKLRWALAGQGKQGGARVIHFWWLSDAKILLLDNYAKNEKEDLSSNELKKLKTKVKP